MLIEISELFKKSFLFSQFSMRVFNSFPREFLYITLVSKTPILYNGEWRQETRGKRLGEPH